MVQHSRATRARPANGRVLYCGPSLIGKGNVVAIATGFSRKSANDKTGDMVQIWILPADRLDPLQAVQRGRNSAACGTCALQGDGRGDRTENRVCYVNLGQAPHQIWQRWKAGAYPPMDWCADGQKLRNRAIRLGAYGDPAALPVPLVRRLANIGRSWTGYSHQLLWIDRRRADALAEYVMCSCHNKAQLGEARRRGYRSFLTVPASYQGNGEQCVECPHYTHNVSCADCQLCCGTSCGARDVFVRAHAKTGLNLSWD